MNANDLRDLLNRDPFEPFRVHLANGGSYDVRAPNNVAVGGNRAFLFFADREGWTFFSYLHVAGVESLNNGRP